MLTQRDAETLTADLAKLSRILRSMARVIAPRPDIRHHAQQLDAVTDAIDKINAGLCARYRHAWPGVNQITARLADITDTRDPPPRIPPSDFVRLLGGE
jgi:hypothetical protein